MTSLYAYIKWNHITQRMYTRKVSLKHLLDTPSFEERKAFTTN